jgi:UDP-glucose 4-epimerase
MMTIRNEHIERQSPMKILVCGGAGYIGAHMVKHLLRDGHVVAVLDDFSTGHRAAVGEAEVLEADICDADMLARILAGRRFDAAMHFGARSLVAESVREPQAYFRNNVIGSVNLLEALRRQEVPRLIFSSTAAVYGEPQAIRIDETHPTVPINPYGASKLMVEQLLADAAAAYGLRSVSLRYFNAAGADADGELGESHTPETHLIPNVLRAASGLGPGLTLFGNDYPTPDGTCVRDYIHVDDLARAHLLALDFLAMRDGAHAFNLGNGQGFSVRDVLTAAERVTGRTIPFEVSPRRSGDPAVLVASAEKAKRELGWQPRHPGIDTIIASAWHWHQSPRF